jgi:NADPH-ferrihemoprotein reductase
MNFSIEKEKREIEEQTLKTLIPNIINYNNTMIPCFTIVYATQSNTSKRFAEKILKDSQILKVKAVLKNISEISLQDLETNLLIVFLVSTYGEGGPTDDSIEFDKFLEKSKAGIKTDDFNCLNELNYSLFGLGSRKYEHFNEMAKRLDKVLNKSGCTKY